MATLKELAALVGGKVVGDEQLEVTRVAPLGAARSGDVTFVASPKHLAGLKGTQASAVILFPGADPGPLPAIVCDNPYLAFAKVLTELQVRRPAPRGVLAGAQVADSAQLAANVTIHPGCVVGERVRIGAGTILYPNVVIYDDVIIGDDCIFHAGAIVREGCHIGHRVILQPGAIIGSDGFGFAPDGERYFKIPQVGIVEIEDDVEIGSATCVDRAALGVTRIRRGVKIDNLVQIAHNVEVGEDTVIVAQVGIAGSTEIGRHCTFGGQSGTAGHLKIGDHVTVGGRGAVAGHVQSKKIISGTPAIDHQDWLKASLVFAKLPELRREINRLKRQLDELTDKMKES